MPLEELLALYRYEPSISAVEGSSADSSSVELTDELPDMTLDKVCCMFSDRLRCTPLFFLI